MLKKVLGAAVLAGAAMLTTTGAAGAATGPDGAPTAADTAAIGQVTGGPATLGRLASTKFPGARAAAAVHGGDGRPAHAGRRLRADGGVRHREVGRPGRARLRRGAGADRRRQHRDASGPSGRARPGTS